MAAMFVLALLIAGCATPQPATPPRPSAEDVARQQRIERAQSVLTEGLKQYEQGAFEDSMKSLLIALDSGVLTVPQQLNARKHMAFIQCVNNREVVCKEEFEKAFALDPKFELSAAESGHPTWGPIYRLVKTELEIKKSGKVLPAPIVKIPTPGEKALAEAMKAYDEADYPKAIKLLQDTLKENLTPVERIKTLKFTAFSYCLTNRLTLCRAEFEKILQIEPNFDLETAEAGHPSWGPPFKTVKAKQKQAASAPAAGKTTK
jgi:tetratricopeptide (TPR) repeat protein